MKNWQPCFVMNFTYRLTKKKRREKEKGHCHRADRYSNKGIQMDCNRLMQQKRNALQLSFFYSKWGEDCACEPFVCVRKRESYRGGSGERWRHKVVWPERQPRQDTSVLVNHWRDIYYLMVGSVVAWDHFYKRKPWFGSGWKKAFILSKINI